MTIATENEEAVRALENVSISRAQGRRAKPHARQMSLNKTQDRAVKDRKDNVPSPPDAPPLHPVSSTSDKPR